LIIQFFIFCPWYMDCEFTTDTDKQLGRQNLCRVWGLKKTLLLWIQGQVYTAVILAKQMALLLTYNCFQNWHFSLSKSKIKMYDCFLILFLSCNGGLVGHNPLLESMCLYSESKSTNPYLLLNSVHGMFSICD
jgi:hypothetical protein